MSLIGAAIVTTFAALAALHLYWGLGGFWPGTDPQSLNDRVSGMRRVVATNLLSCAMVAGALLAAAAIVIFRHTLAPTGVTGLVIYGGYATLILVFGLRGLAPYVTPAFNYARGKPFYTLNRRYYAPLCLLIAVGLFADFPH